MECNLKAMVENIGLNIYPQYPYQSDNGYVTLVRYANTQVMLTYALR